MEMSAAMPLKRPPASAIWGAVSSRPLCFGSIPTTAALSAVRRLAVARPILEPAPVTIAPFPASLVAAVIALLLGREGACRGVVAARGWIIGGSKAGCARPIDLQPYPPPHDTICLAGTVACGRPGCGGQAREQTVGVGSNA